MDIRRKTLDIALDLVNPKNIDEVISVLKKEINKTQSKELEKVKITILEALLQSINLKFL